MAEAFVSGVWGTQTNEPSFNAEYLKGDSLDIPTEVDRAIAVLGVLGGIGDKDRARESFTRDLQALKRTGLAMRIVPDVPGENLPWTQLSAIVNDKTKAADPDSYYPNLYISGTEAGSYTKEELDGVACRVSLRGLLLAAPYADRPDVDKALHYLDRPYDDYARDRWNPNKTPQLEVFAADQLAFKSAFPGLSLQLAGHRDFAFSALDTRLGKLGHTKPHSKELPLLSMSYMCSNLGRRKVGGVPVVGSFLSLGDRLMFGYVDGRARPRSGVGLLAGVNETVTAD